MKGIMDVLEAVTKANPNERQEYIESVMIRNYGYTWQEIREAQVNIDKSNVRYVSQPEEFKKIVHDSVKSPSHYTKGGIEAIDYIQAKLSPEQFKGYLKGSLLKYASRMGDKDSLRLDAGKCGWYAKRLEKLL